MNILITGGSSGLGRCLVSKCAKKDDGIVYFTYFHKEEEARSLERQFSNVRAIKLDFSDMKAVTLFSSTFLFSEIDVIVNNAYVGSPNGTYFHKTDLDSFHTSFVENILPTICINQACIRAFRKKRNGRIINVLSSYIMDLPPSGFSVYSSNKAYLSQLTKCWCKENIKFGITVNCVLPEFMQTSFADIDDRIKQNMEQEHPLKELLQPEDVADVILGLMNFSKQISGTAIPITASQHINF